MNNIQNIGLGLFMMALVIFTVMLGMGGHELKDGTLHISNDVHKDALKVELETSPIWNKNVHNIAFISEFKKAYARAQVNLETSYNPEVHQGNEWDYKLGSWKQEEYLITNIKSSETGIIVERPWLFFFLTFGLAIIGGLLYIIPLFIENPGIKHDHIYHNSLTRGLKVSLRKTILWTTIIGVLLYGVFYMHSALFWPVTTLIFIGIIMYLVLYKENQKDFAPPRSASPIHTGWLGLIAGFYFIGFYLLLYWAPAYITNWTTMVSPLSKMLSGNEASQWFLYGLMYTVIVFVMGIRMLSKYQHNRYQRVRTYSVMFFQTAFAFLIPEMLVRFNQPWYDFKNMWPLDYDFFFSYNIDNLISSGGLGLFMLVWGILLFAIGVPVITYFYGKRWYCSWVCGCGGLAETLGDPYRQLSDKSLRAWKYERYIIHGVLLLAITMTAMVLYSYFTGKQNILFFNSDSVKQWYGFIIGAGFAGVVGTGFYPLMGNRVWCRFGCPLAAYLGLVQKFKSRFRITVNGGQCISCGNCSTYCEMGIDVKQYAQRGQDIVRSSCVGCGVCAAVCPRGVLKLENGSSDVDTRTNDLRVIHISEDDVRILS